MWVIFIWLSIAFLAARTWKWWLIRENSYRHSWRYSRGHRIMINSLSLIGGPITLIAACIGCLVDNWNEWTRGIQDWLETPVKYQFFSKLKKYKTYKKHDETTNTH